jgi:hypothetical protein
MAMGAAGCGDDQSDQTDQTESPKESSAEAAAAKAKRILEAVATNEKPKPVGAPGFFGDGPARGRRKDNPDDRDADPLDLIATTEPATQPKPVKRPPPKPVTPDEQAAKQVKFAKLYLANAAAAAPATAGRKRLNKEAATILKEVISKHPNAPAATEAAKLLAGIEAAQ